MIWHKIRKRVKSVDGEPKTKIETHGTVTYKGFRRVYQDLKKQYAAR